MPEYDVLSAIFRLKVGRDVELSSVFRSISKESLMLRLPEIVLSTVMSSDLWIVPLYDLLSTEVVADSELTPGGQKELFTSAL